MTPLELQVRRAQRRLWSMRWMGQLGWSLAIAAALFCIVIVAQRLSDRTLPLAWVGLGLGCAGIVAAVIWTLVTRETRLVAAATLDKAAGLKERISTGLTITDPADPFAQAARQDADYKAQSITVSQHIRWRWHRSGAYAVGGVTVALILWAIPGPWITPTVARDMDNRRPEQIERTKVAVNQRLQELKKEIQSNSALKDLKEDLHKLNDINAPNLDNPYDVRREGVKKIDSLADALKKQRMADEFTQLNQLKKMLSTIKPAGAEDTPAKKLADALSQGDFKAALEATKELQENLAKFSKESDPQKTAEMKEQLADLAKKLDKLADAKKLEQELERAGVKPEDAQRMLEHLSKKDLSEIKEELKKAGVKEEQLQKLAEQLKNQSSAASQCQKLADAMKQASQGTEGGGQSQIGESMQGLSMAEDALSEMEQLEQEMNQLDSMLSSMQDAKDELSNSCQSCNGTGMQGGKSCSACQGSGAGQQPGQGGSGKKIGQGKGGVQGEQETAVAYKSDRGKVHTGKGAIIGQFMVDGEQIKGESRAEFAEAAQAAEREATEAINRENIPRQYHSIVKWYFSRIQKPGRATAGDAASKTDGEESGDSETGTDKAEK